MTCASSTLTTPPLDDPEVGELESVINDLHLAKVSDCSSVDSDYKDADELETFLLQRGVIAPGHKAPRFSMANLEQALQDWRFKKGCSIKALKKELDAVAIHLGTGAYFGQKSELIMAILLDKHKRVGKQNAKKYHLFKNCLVVLA